MNINLYADNDLQELKDKLGWWEHGESPAFGELVAVCMILCDKITDLKQTINKLANDASCRDNGIIPD